MKKSILFVAITIVLMMGANVFAATFKGTPVDGPMKNVGHVISNPETGVFAHATSEQMLVIEQAQANGNDVEIVGEYGVNEYNFVVDGVREVATDTVKKCPYCGHELP